MYEFRPAATDHIAGRRGRRREERPPPRPFGGDQHRSQTAEGIEQRPAKRAGIADQVCQRRHRLVMTAALWLMNGGVKPILEYQSAIRRLGPHGWIDFILQNIYYAFEMLVALLMCALGQEAGEILTAKKKIPWGGILLGILWGLPHLLSKNLLVGLVSIIIGILLGLPYLLLNKNAKLTWLFMFLMFVL